MREFFRVIERVKSGHEFESIGEIRDEWRKDVRDGEAQKDSERSETQVVVWEHILLNEAKKNV